MKNELTQSQYDMIDSALDYLGIVERDGCKIYFNSKCQFGAYHHFGDYISIMDVKNCLPEMIPNIVHELTHRKQRQRMGLFKYALLSCRWWYLTTIEPEAIRNYNKAEGKLNDV